MKYNEVCPQCGSEEYETEDYGDSFDQFGAEQWWTCVCNDCGCTFSITKMYDLKNVIIEEVSES